MKRLERTTFMALLGAAFWGAILLAGAFFFPAFSSAGEEVPAVGAVTEAPVTTHTTAALAGVSGADAIAAAGVPLLAAVAVAVALRLSSRRGAVPVAWILTGLLAAFNLLTMASVGLFFLPVTVALIIACCTCQPGGGRRAAATAGERTA